MMNLKKIHIVFFILHSTILSSRNENVIATSDVLFCQFCCYSDSPMFINCDSNELDSDIIFPKPQFVFSDKYKHLLNDLINRYNTKDEIEKVKTVLLYNMDKIPIEFSFFINVENLIINGGTSALFENLNNFTNLKRIYILESHLKLQLNISNFYI